MFVSKFTDIIHLETQIFFIFIQIPRNLQSKDLMSNIEVSGDTSSKELELEKVKGSLDDSQTSQEVQTKNIKPSGNEGSGKNSTHLADNFVY